MFKRLFNTMLYVFIAVFTFSVFFLVLPKLFLFGTPGHILGTFIMTAGLVLFIYIFYMVMYRRVIHFISGIEKRKLLLIIILLAFILRLVWILLIPTQPVSDFGLMFKGGRNVVLGDFSQFKGSGYFARFTHDTVTVLYFSLFYRITDNPLFLIKFFNVLFSTFSVYAIYLLLKEAFSEKSGLLGAFLLSIFPPFIMYTSQTMSENMAMPFFVLSVYLFLKAFGHKKGSLLFLLCGAVLSIANMFRMVGMIFLIAYVMYAIFYNSFLGSIKSCAIIIIGFVVPLYLTSSVLQYAGITQNHLWSPGEPSITSVLKGTNFKSNGAWNTDDAHVPDICGYDAGKISEMAKQIIKQRFQNAAFGQIVRFYEKKFTYQWYESDFDARFWTIDRIKDGISNQSKDNLNVGLNFLCSIYYLFLLGAGMLSIVLRKKYRNEKTFFFYILFIGFVLLYFITEVQARYSFIITWAFIVFAVDGIRKIRQSNFNIRKYKKASGVPLN